MCNSYNINWGGGEIEKIKPGKPHFFLPGQPPGVPTTLPTTKPARKGSICGQGARFLQGIFHPGTPGFAARGGAGQGCSAAAIHFSDYTSCL